MKVARDKLPLFDRHFGTDLTNLKTVEPSQHPLARGSTGSVPKEDILAYIFSKEDAQCSPDYFAFQKELQESMRSILVEWLVDIHFKMKLKPESLFLAVSVLDRYLGLRTVQKSRLQLAGVTALLVACKFQETYNLPKLSDLTYVCADIYSKQDLLECEADILAALAFSVHKPTPFEFMNLLAPLIDLDSKNYHLTWYLLELSLLNYRLSRVSPGLLAVSALFLVNKIRKRSFQYCSRLLLLSNFGEQDVRAIARELSEVLQKVEFNKFAAKLRDKFNLSEHEAVASIRVERVAR